MKSNAGSQNTLLGVIGISFIVLIIWIIFHEFSQAPWQFITVLIALLGGIITSKSNYSS